MWGLQACFLRAPDRLPCPPTWSLCVRGRGRRRLVARDWWVSVWGVAFEGPGSRGAGSSEGLVGGGSLFARGHSF